MGQEGKEWKSRCKRKRGKIKRKKQAVIPPLYSKEGESEGGKSTEGQVKLMEIYNNLKLTSHCHQPWFKAVFNERKDESEKKEREKGLRPYYKLDGQDRKLPVNLPHHVKTLQLSRQTCLNDYFCVQIIHDRRLKDKKKNNTKTVCKKIQSNSISLLNSQGKDKKNHPISKTWILSRCSFGAVLIGKTFFPSSFKNKFKLHRKI